MAATHFIDLFYPPDDKELQFECEKHRGNTLKKKNKTEIQLQTKLSCHGSKFQFALPYLMQIQ